MIIISALAKALLKISGRAKIKEAIEGMDDTPSCLSCQKETLKIIEEKWCFQCYFAGTSKEHH